MILTVAAFVHLATQCGPAVHVDTLTAIAQAESRLDTLAIHDNTTGQSYHPTTIEAAKRIGADLVTTKHHSADLGVMQLNSANLAPFGMTIADAFDACKNIAAGARVLVAGYKAPATGDTQPALLRALSRYNTGHPSKGFTNGYVHRVQVAAGEVVPAIRVDGSSDTGKGGQEEGEGAIPPPPPSWDVFARARYERRYGRSERGVKPDTSKPATASPANLSGNAAAEADTKPVTLQPITGAKGGGSQ